MRIGAPLVLASAGHAFRLFIDRVMLARYSPEAIAASMPAGMLCFSLMAFFIGTTGYVNTFVAQYSGAGQRRETGSAVWQGLYIAAIGGIVMAIISLQSEAIFALMGHAPEVQAEEVPYFRVMSCLGFPTIALSALNAFWSGRGRTRVVMAIELLCAGVNVALNAILIFGYAGIPEMGIVGAGIATSIASACGALLGAYLFLRPSNRSTYGTWPLRTFNPDLFRRVIRFGLPNGVQLGLELLAFMVFVAVLGRQGSSELEAANIAFSLNAMAFLPMLGLGVAVSVIVGQSVGAGNIPVAQRAVRSGFIMAVLCDLVIGSAFLLAPDAIISVFARAGDAAQAATLKMAKHCLFFVTAYLLFDAVYLVYSHAIKGAGDTRYALCAGILVSWGTLALPTWIAVRGGASFWTLWAILVVHVFIAAAVFATRYFGGKWQGMRVIEEWGPESVIAEVDLQADRGI
ncbi:MAG: MATE family efflux transporter [Verrucomicrobia bacterium]|nr:MATE family efflux transporter [Verrucomicrobiota bacterium]MDA1087084.1 MATE family efflux transporter [Verrucomicrobiota bacterium]